MSSPYQNFPDDAAQGYPTGLPGFSLRRSSYASIASGGPFGRSGATFAQLLNPTNGDGADTNGNRHGGNGVSHGLGSNGHGGGGSGSGSTRTPYGMTPMASEALREDLDAGELGMPHWVEVRNAPLPSFSRAFEPFLRGPLYEGPGLTTVVPPVPPTSNSGFFTPSYLRDSVYVQRLESQVRARARARTDNQRSFPKLVHPGGGSSSGGVLAGVSGSAAGATTGDLLAGAAASAADTVDGTGDGSDDLEYMANTLAPAGISSSSSSRSQVGGGVGGSSTSNDMIWNAPYFAAQRAAAAGQSGPLPTVGAPCLGVSEDSSSAEEPLLPLLPTRWNIHDKQSSLDVQSEGLDVKCITPSDRDQEANSIRADHYIPPQCGIYYFEVTILSKKRDESTIGIGFSESSASLTRPPGWEPASWGYHSDDGNIFSGHSGGKQYGPTFTSSDVVGCGINFRAGTAFFTKNGVYLDTAFRNIKGSMKLYPSVGLKKAGEHVRVNFGQVPFAFEIDSMVKQVRMGINQEIASTKASKLAPPLSESELVQQLVLEFLQHDGYVETAQAFAEEVRMQKQALNLNPDKVIPGISIADDDDARSRQKIRRAVLEGDIDRALKLTNAYYPHVLKENDEVLFRLQCRKFIELIRQEAEMNLVGSADSDAAGSGLGTSEGSKSANGHSAAAKTSRAHAAHQDMDMDDIDMVEAGTDGHAENGALVEEAILYGQVLQSQYANDSRSQIRNTLAEVFSLMAYSNPLKEKGVAHLLDQNGRVAVAEELNSAILQSLGKSSRAALEVLYAQTSVLLEDLRDDGGPGSFVAIQSVIDQIPQSPTF